MTGVGNAPHQISEVHSYEDLKRIDPAIIRLRNVEGKQFDVQHLGQEL